MASIDFLKRYKAPVDARPLWSAIAFLLVALGVGGAGIGYPLAELAIELSAIALIVRTALATPPAERGWPFRAILALFGTIALFGVAQLVPLPAGVWRALPDRAIAANIYDALGWSANWHAASLTPDRTLLDLLAVLPALASFLLIAALSERRRVTVLRIVVGMAILGTLFGAIQVAAGAQGAPVLFETIHRGFGVGVFVNRNHQATFLLVAMVLAAVPGVVSLDREAPRRAKRGSRANPQRRDSPAVTLGVVAFLALGVLATTSRTGLALLPLALIVAVGIVLQPRRQDRATPAWGRYWIPGALLVYAVAGAALYPTSLVQGTLARFATASEDLRYQYWENTRFAIGAAWPWGTGLGSFDSVYRSVEPLAQVAPAWVNHAHNEYLELALEGGVVAIVWMAVALVVVIAAFVHAWRHATSAAQRAGVVAGAAGIALILLCSVVDFPLRMAAIGVLFGALLGFAVSPPRRQSSAAQGAGGTARHLWSLATIAVGLAVGWLSLSGGLATALAQRGQPVLATALAPWVARGWSERANQEQLAGHPGRSGDAALQALEIQPLDSEALRAIGSAELAAHHADRGTALLQLGAALGWRDTVTQLWLARRALEVGNVSVAVERIDGMLRRGVQQPLMQRQLRAVFVYPGGVDTIAARLAQRAPWRQGFLNAIADDSPQAVPQVFALLRALARAGVPADSVETALIRWRLADAGDYADARRVWLATGGRGWIADGDFDHASGVLPDNAAPFAWRAPASSGVHLTVIDPDSGDSGRSLMIASDGYAARPVLAQTIVLAPGRYRFGVSFRAGGDATPPPAGWSLACLRPDGADEAAPIALQFAAPSRGWIRGTGAFTVPPGCAGATLALTLRESAGSPFTLQVDGIRIDRLVANGAAPAPRVAQEPVQPM